MYLTFNETVFLSGVLFTEIIYIYFIISFQITLFLFFNNICVIMLHELFKTEILERIT